MTSPRFVALKCVLVWSCWSLVALSTAQEIVAPRVLPPDVQEIDLVYVEQRSPSLSWKTALPPARPAPVRPEGSTVDLLALLAAGQTFGDCQSQVQPDPAGLLLHLQGVGQRPCGLVFSLAGAGAGLDVLSYTMLHLRGTASAPFTLALADVAASQRQDSVPLRRLSGNFALQLPMAPVARRLDLRRLVSLVLLPETQNLTVRLDSLSLEQAEHARQTVPKRGFWLWQYRQVIAAPDSVLDTCQHYNCQRLLIQIPAETDSPEVWNAYVHFLRSARRRGIEAFALDGYPEAIHQPTELLNKWRRLRTALAGTPLDGLQLDVEPYLLPDFFADATGFARYLALIEQVREVVQGQAPLSVVLPFWLAEQMLHGRPVAFAVMDRVDEVAVMSYRTTMDEVRAIADDILRYGVLAGVPVWLAIETVPLPVEQHVLLKRETRRDLADAYLDQTRQRLILAAPPATPTLLWFRVQHRTTVRPERITFAGQPRGQVRQAVERLIATVSQSSLAGVLIHDLQGFLALREPEDTE